MSNMADGLNFQPRIGEPESSAGPRAQPVGGLQAFLAPNIPDTSGPGPTPLQAPVRWVYDFDPATGVARATFNGEVSGPAGPIGGVASFNTRTGAVVLLAADVTAAGGALLSSPALIGTPTAPTAAPGTTTTQLATTAFVGASFLPLAGVTNGSDAPAGQIGEIIAANITAAVTLTTGVAINIGSIALTAGDWDVQGEIWYAAGSTTLGSLQAAIGNASATVPAATSIATARTIINNAMTAGAAQTVPIRACRVSLSTPATYFLVSNQAFTGALTATGNIWARRAR